MRWNSYSVSLSLDDSLNSPCDFSRRLARLIFLTGSEDGDQRSNNEVP